MNSGYLLALSFLLFVNATAGTTSRLKKYLSHDSAMVASIYTVVQEGNGDSESKIEFRTSKGVLIGAKSFLSKDHAHGLGVVKATWTLDSRYFIFSTMASGGRLSGNFPTFFFNRADNQLHLIDAFKHSKIVSPEFETEFPDGVSFTIESHSADGKYSHVISPTLYLSKLKDK